MISGEALLKQEQKHDTNMFSGRLFGSLFENIHSTLRKITTTSSLSFFRFPESPSLDKKTPVHLLLTDIFEHTLLNIHYVHETLNFWKASQLSSSSSSSNDPQTIYVLEGIQMYLAIFLSKLYKEVEDPSPAKFLQAINSLFLDLQDSLCYINNLICSPFSFEPLGSEDAGYHNDTNANLIRSNLNTLETYLSLVINKYRKPNTIIQHWKGYTVGAIGIALFSVWLLRHTNVPGVINNWVLQAKESITKFSIYQEPLTTIRDELSLKKQEKVMELKKIQSTSDFLHSEFLYISERNERLENASYQGMLERLKGSIEKLFRYPIREIFMEGLTVSMLNHTRMQKYDIEKEILELDRQLLRANEKKIAFGNLLSMFLSVGASVISLWVTKFIVAERKGRIARVQIRRLIIEVEKKIIELERWSTLENEEFHYNHGLILYTLDRLYKVLEWEVKSTIEWPCLEEEVFFLGKTDIPLMDKLTVISCMKHEYASYWYTISSLKACMSR